MRDGAWLLLYSKTARKSMRLKAMAGEMHIFFYQWDERNSIKHLKANKW
jgi:hypothetical protein